MKNPLKRNPEQYPQYWRTGKGVYAKVTGPDTFIKSFWLPDQSGKVEFGTEKVKMTGRTCSEVFQRPAWTRCNKKQWEKHLEPIASADRGVRGQKSLEFVFEHKGVKYWRYKDLQDYPIGRMKEFESVLTELSYMASPEAVDQFFDVLIDLTSGKDGNVNIGQVAAIIREANNRRKLGFDTNIWRRIGTVVFFTEDEDTSRIDFAGMKDKLDAWADLSDNFFLNTPLKDYLPFEAKSTEDLANSLMKAVVKHKISTAHLKKLFKAN